MGPFAEEVLLSVTVINTCLPISRDYQTPEINNDMKIEPNYGHYPCTLPNNELSKNRI